MPTYVIEREIPGADKLTAQELKEISAKSNEVVAGLGVPYKWITSYVAGDKIYCVHEAESAEVVRRHASKGGFPINKVTEVAAMIGPATGR
jgi:Nickel responsive protein SCO4226-like